jgi:zinc D-Ala-D-Ala carboxypeptidase
VAYSARAHRAPRRLRVRKNEVALLVAVAAIAAALGHGSRPTTSSTTRTHARTASRPRHAPVIPLLRSPDRDALGEAGGALPSGTTVFDDDVPGVAKLDPALLAALRRAAADAGGQGVDFVVDSGWRSPAYQEHLLEQAVSKYGSEAAAARWVATPKTSPHVAGEAVDIRPGVATQWLSAHGAAYGLCQIYGNEPWHYELRPAAVDHGCPAMYADPTRDPRMRGSAR